MIFNYWNTSNPHIALNADKQPYNINNTVAIFHNTPLKLRE